MEPVEVDIQLPALLDRLGVLFFRAVTQPIVLASFSHSHMTNKQEYKQKKILKL